MSISTIQEKLFNKGCGSVLIVVAAVAMGLSMFSQCGTASRMSPEEQARQQSAVALIGDVPVLSDAIQAQASKIGGQDLMGQSTALVYATGGALRAAAVRALIAQGPEVSEAEITKAAEKFADQQIDQVKGQLMAEGKVKPGASDAEFDKAVKSAGSPKTLSAMRAEALATIKEAYKDPSRKGAVIETLGDAILTSRLGEKATSDDAALRESYKTYVVRRIFFSARSGAKETPEQRAAKALADLKAGKSFDKLMDTLSNDPAPPGGKPLHELTQPIPSEALSRQPELATLKGKPIGTTTEVVDVPGGKAIYQLSSIQDQLPTDFDKNKQKYRSQRADEVGRAELEKQIQTLLASDTVKWQHKGFQALAAAYNAMTLPTGPNEEALGKAMQIAQDATKSTNEGEKQVGARAMLAISSMLDRVPTADQAKTIALKLSAFEAVQATGLQDAATSLQLADLYADAKNGAKAAEALVAASKNNTRYDAEGERLFREIAGKALKLQTSKVITKEQYDMIQAQQAVWTSTKTQNAKAEAEAKAEMEKQQKANEAEIARQKAEAAKSGTPSVTTTGGATTGGTGTTALITGSSIPSTSTQGTSPQGAPAPGGTAGSGKP